MLDAFTEAVSSGVRSHDATSERGQIATVAGKAVMVVVVLMKMIIEKVVLMTYGLSAWYEPW